MSPSPAADLIAASKRYNVRMIGGLAAVLALSFGLMIGPPAAGWTTGDDSIIPAIGGAVAFFGGLFLVAAWADRVPGLRCPHCVAFLGTPAVAATIASRHCPKCGRRVIADPPDELPATLSIATVRDTATAAVALPERMKWPLGAAFIGGMGGIALAAVFRDSLRAAVVPNLGPDAGDGVFFVLLAVPMVIALGWLVAVAIRAERAAGKCPHCAAPMLKLASLAAATGNCGACGRRVAALPVDDLAGPRLTVADITPTISPTTRAANRWVIAGGLGTVGLLAIVSVAGQFIDHRSIVAAWEVDHGPVGAAYREAAVKVVLGLAALAPGAVGFVVAARRLERSGTRPACPHCAKSIGGGFTVATKRCHGCFRRVLADP